MISFSSELYARAALAAEGRIAAMKIGIECGQSVSFESWKSLHSLVNVNLPKLCPNPCDGYIGHLNAELNEISSLNQKLINSNMNAEKSEIKGKNNEISI